MCDAPAMAGVLARARTRATFHRFAEALADLDAAEQRGADSVRGGCRARCDLPGVGRSAEALVLRWDAALRRPDFATLGALAVLQAERGEVTEAEKLFTEARRRYRGVSPFPVAKLDFRRGLMWFGAGRPARGPCLVRRRRASGAGLRPGAGAPCRGRCRSGSQDAAIDRLRPLAGSSDDPEYAGILAGLLTDGGRPREAEQWRVSAAARYDELVRRHPEAFADHAAEFWLTAGGDRPRGLQLVERHREDRRTSRSHALLRRATPAG